MDYHYTMNKYLRSRSSLLASEDLLKRAGLYLEENHVRIHGCVAVETVLLRGIGVGRRKRSEEKRKEVKRRRRETRRKKEERVFGILRKLNKKTGRPVYYSAVS